MCVPQVTLNHHHCAYSQINKETNNNKFAYVPNQITQLSPVHLHSF